METENQKAVKHATTYKKKNGKKKVNPSFSTKMSCEVLCVLRSNWM